MKKVLFILVSMMLTVSVMAQQKIQLRSVDKAECVKSDMTSLRASFSFSTIESENVDTQRGPFSWLSMPNTVIGGNEGDPQIPVVNELIAVPFGANPTITVTSYSTTDYQLNELGIDRLVPRQPSLRKDQKPEEVPFIMNEAAYQSTRGLRGEPTAVVQVVGTMRGVQLGKMTIEPVSYDPVNKTLRVFNDIEVEVSFDGADARATEDILVKTYSPYFDGIYKMLFNGRSVLSAYDDHPDLYTTPVKMLVVTTSTYSNSTPFQEWLTWKKQKGIDVDVQLVTSSTSSSNVRSLIQTQYNANHPTFLVIVGDESAVKNYTTWSDNSLSYSPYISDNAYASIDSDVYHDMFMSRMSVSSTTELGYLVDKILMYEKYTMPDPSYLSNVLLIAGYDSNWADKVGRPTINYAANNYYNSDHGFVNVYKYVTSSYTGCYNYLSSGVGFANYTAHGDIQMWYQPQLTNSDVNSLTNTNKYFWAMGNCCLTANWGNTSTYPCFGEAMIRAQNKGAFGYIGSIPESYWYEDYYFGVGATSVMSQTPSMSQTTTGVYDFMFDDTQMNTLNSVPFAGNVAVTYAHANNYTSSVSDEYYWRGYQCLGDGSVMPYHVEPAANSVSHASTINIGATTFTVNAVAGSYVAITKGNEILGVAEVPDNGTVNVPISGLTSAGDVMIVVTRQQRQPYITTIQAASLNGPYISLDSYTPNTALVGESTNLSLTLKNVGNQATSGTTTVTLSSTNNNVTFGTQSKTFSTLAANATTTVSGFSFTLNSGITVGSTVTLHYTAVNGSNTWEGDFTITANQIFNVTVAANHDNYGTVSGGGQFNYNESCTVTATPLDGYMFSNWTQNGSVVSTEAAYTFNVTSDMNLVANFTEGVMIGSGTTTNNYLPSYSYYKYALSQQIYTAAELGGAGTITSIAFYNDGSEKTRTYDFYMKTTTKSSFSSATDWITVTADDKVFSGSVTMVAGDWTTITFTTPFVYDGTSNVVLVADDNTGSYTNSPHMACRVFSATSQALYAYDDNTNYDPLSPPTSTGSYNSVLSVKNQLIVTKESASDEPVTITLSVNPANAGTVSGGGEFTIGETCTVTATPAEGYSFTSWTKNGTAVSTSAAYSFTVTGATTLVANFTLNSYNVTATANPAEGGTIIVGSAKGNRDDLVYDFEDGYQGWTTLKGTTGNSPNNWHHNTEHVSYSSGTAHDWSSFGHNSSSGFMISESYISATSSSGTAYGAVTPDNYLISPQVRLGGSISFYAGARNTSYCAEKFSVMVSTTNNTSTDSFTTIETWILSLSEVGYTSSPYTVDLSAYDGQMGYVAIRHWDCNDQWVLCIDDITIVEGTDHSNGSGNFNHGETCMLTASPSTGYHFVNWTENGTEVSTDAYYTFTVTGDRDLVANFSQEQTQYYTITLTANPAEGGTVSGAGTYPDQATPHAIATPNEGYTFVNWTENGVEVSTNANYYFTCDGDRDLVANFVATGSHAITLPSGWNWWSTYLDIDLADLEEALGAAGISITSQDDGFIGNYSGTWTGGLLSISPSKMYMIQIAEEVSITLNGTLINPVDYPITLNQGANWIGYPVSQSMSLNEAFAGANPENGDMVSSYDKSSQYYNGTWYGNLQTLEPGHGYIYMSKASGTKTFTYPSSK